LLAEPKQPIQRIGRQRLGKGLGEIADRIMQQRAALGRIG